MFKIDTADKRIEFTFQHRRNVEDVFLNKHPVTDSTLCFLFVNGVRYFGDSWCSALDQFNAETGRKNALKKALDASGLTREDRAEVWDRYHNRHVSNADYAAFRAAEDFMHQRLYLGMIPNIEVL